MSDYQNVFSYEEWPLAKFYFKVTIEGDGINGQISFQAVDGLESEITIIEYRDGDSPYLFKSKRYGMVNYSNVTLKKGMFASDTSLMVWWHTFAWGHAPRDKRYGVTIELMDENNESKMLWNLKGCFPIKFSPTGMDAEADSEIAIEEMELAVESWTLEIA